MAELTVEYIKAHTRGCSWIASEVAAKYVDFLLTSLANKERETAEKQWIDTRDRLPMYGEPCLIIYHDQIQHITYYLSDEDGLWWPCDETTVELDEGMDCYDADKWMSLLGLDK